MIEELSFVPVLERPDLVSASVLACVQAWTGPVPAQALTVAEGEALRFTGVPSFAPELLQRVRALDPMRAKHLQKALEHFAEEGASQFFRPFVGSDLIVGVVGQLQFDVLAARVSAEYALDVRFEPAPFDAARWIEADDPKELERFLHDNRGTCGEDHDGAPVFLARNSWALSRAQQDFPAIRFKKTREQNACGTSS